MSTSVFVPGPALPGLPAQAGVRTELLLGGTSAHLSAAMSDMRKDGKEKHFTTQNQKQFR